MKKRQKEKYIKTSGERQQTVDKFKNYFRDIFDEAINEEKEEMEDMIRENLHTRLENERKNNRKGEGFSDVKKGSKVKESMTDVVNNNTPNVSKKNNTNYQTIKTRKFDPTNDEDTNLLITKEILEDIINRITYQYESTDYLKRYISTRLQEIIRLNRLLNLDDDDDDN